MKKTHAAPHRHAVQFYEDTASLCRMAAGFLADGLTAGGPSVVIATPPHEAQILDELNRRGVNVEQARRDGQLVMLDADETLGVCMIDGSPDADLFATYMGIVLDQLGRIQPGTTIRAYGEMVDVLWKS